MPHAPGSLPGSPLSPIALWTHSMLACAVMRAHMPVPALEFMLPKHRSLPLISYGHGPAAGAATAMVMAAERVNEPRWPHDHLLWGGSEGLAQKRSQPLSPSQRVLRPEGCLLG